MQTAWKWWFMFHETAQGKPIQFWGCLSLSSTNCSNGRADDKMQLGKQVAAWKALIWEMNCTHSSGLWVRATCWTEIGTTEIHWVINRDAEGSMWMAENKLKNCADKGQWWWEAGRMKKEHRQERRGKKTKYEKKVERWEGLEMTNTCRVWNQIRK